MKIMQIRKVPDDLHKKIKVAAAQAGKPVQTWIIDILRKEVEKAGGKK